MMSIERFKLITSMYLILIRDGQVLLSRRYNTGYEDGKFSLPAGHLEAGETLRAGLVREVREEIGIDVDQDRLELVHVMHRKESDIRIDLFFTVKGFRGEPINAELSKCDLVKWFALDKLPTLTIPYIRQAIDSYRKGIHYSEIGW